MPKVHHVKKARKDNSAVQAGQPYYWWKFRYGGVRKSASYPRQSQLCQGKNSMFYAALEGLEDACKVADGSDSLEGTRDECVSNLGEVRDEYQEGFDNLPENFQYAATGEAIQEAIDAIEELISELECWEFEEFDREDFDEDKPSPEDYDEDDDGADEYQSDVSDWRLQRDEHAEDQATQEEDHHTEQRDNLIELGQEHAFPY